MVSGMQVSDGPLSVLLRIGLAAGYLVLALALNPLLLHHELALPTDSHHSEADLCTWLDHIAGTSLQSAFGHLIVTWHPTPLVLPFDSLPRSLPLFVDPSRGPPALI